MLFKGNQIPSLGPHNGTLAINNQEFLYVTKDSQTTFTVNGTDDGQLRFQFINNTDSVQLQGSPSVNGIQTVAVHLTDDTPVKIRWVVRVSH